MIKRYYLILQKFFSLKAHDNRLVFHLFFSALLRSISLLLIPVAAAKVVEFATIKDYQTTFLLLASYTFYVIIIIILLTKIIPYLHIINCKN